MVYSLIIFLAINSISTKTMNNCTILPILIEITFLHLYNIGNSFPLKVILWKIQFEIFFEYYILESLGINNYSGIYTN